MADERIALPHKLTLSERKKLTMTGVTEVVSFEEDAVVLKTALGTLVIQGRELQLKTISALVYEEPKRSGGALRRLFG